MLLKALVAGQLIKEIIFFAASLMRIGVLNSNIIFFFIKKILLISIYENFLIHILFR